MTVHCPECGRPNPDEAYICQFCNKPLVEYTPHQIQGDEQEKIVPKNEESQDWLQNLRQKKEEDAKLLGEDYFNRYGSLNPDEKPPEEEKPSADLDGWINQLNPESSAIAPEESSEQLTDSAGTVEPTQGETQPEEQAPGWLENIRSKIASEGTPPESESTSEEDSGDWLTRLRKQTDQLHPEVLQKIESEEPKNPEWLDRVEAIPPVELFPVITPGESVTEPPDEEPAPPPAQAGFVSPFTDDLPEDFASGITPEDDLNVFPEQPYKGMQEETEHPIPEALRNSLPQIEAGSLPEDTIPPEEELLKMNEQPREKISSKDIPSWLSNILGENEAEAPNLDAVQTGSTEGTEGEPVEPGPLPNWVQAMRPVEINAKEKSSQEVTDKHIEEEGPLAGIRGILPGESPTITYSLPVGYNISSEVQKPIAEKVALFTEMLQEEKVEAPAPGFKKIRAAGTVRWIVMVLMIAIMIYPIISGIAPVNLSNTIPIETGALFRSINSLPADSKILVVLDYEPAYAAEIEMAANAVLNQLMVKSANLFVITTQPAGTAMGQKLLDDIAAFPQNYHEAYIAGEKYHLIGYLPGGQAGIQALNNSLINTIPLTVDLKKTVDLDGLGGSMPIREFDGLLVLSDQSDTLRLWVEQLQRSNGKPELWAVVTAQAAPMLRPYVRANQINGMVTGEYGGSLYERIFQQPGLARLQWNTFQTGVLAAVILILVGGVLNYLGQVILQLRKQKSP